MLVLQLAPALIGGRERRGVPGQRVWHEDEGRRGGGAGVGGRAHAPDDGGRVGRNARLIIAFIRGTARGAGQFPSRFSVARRLDVSGFGAWMSAIRRLGVTSRVEGGPTRRRARELVVGELLDRIGRRHPLLVIGSLRRQIAVWAQTALSVVRAAERF